MTNDGEDYLRRWRAHWSCEVSLPAPPWPWPKTPRARAEVVDLVRSEAPGQGIATPVSLRYAPLTWWRTD